MSPTEKINIQDDHAMADLLSTLARQYHKQISDQTLPKNKTRLEILRRLELIAQSIKGLMTHPQEKIKPDS